MKTVDRPIDLSWISAHPDITSDSDSTAPAADRLLGLATGDVVRAMTPSIVESVVKASAMVRGFLQDPLRAGQARDRLLAHDQPAFELNLAGGGKLQAFHAMSGFFEVHLRPRLGDFRASTIQVSLPEPGRESVAKVRAHVHAPDAPIGFYNARRSREIIEATTRVLEHALTDADTSRVNRMRAQLLLERLQRTQARVEAMCGTLDAYPDFAAAVETARASAYEIRRAGDETDQAFGAAMADLRATLNQGAIPAHQAEVLRRDLDILQSDRDKWLAYRSNDVATFWVRRA